MARRAYALNCRSAILPRHREVTGEHAMLKTSLGFRFAASAGAVAPVFALSSIEPAPWQEAKSIRCATSSVDSYGYKVAASMVKIVEAALGGEYTVTVNPYPSTTGAMKAGVDGTGETGYQ